MPPHPRTAPDSARAPVAQPATRPASQSVRRSRDLPGAVASGGQLLQYDGLVTDAQVDTVERRWCRSTSAVGEDCQPVHSRLVRCRRDRDDEIRHEAAPGHRRCDVGRRTHNRRLTDQGRHCDQQQCTDGSLDSDRLARHRSPAQPPGVEQTQHAHRSEQTGLQQQQAPVRRGDEALRGGHLDAGAVQP